MFLIGLMTVGYNKLTRNVTPFLIGFTMYFLSQHINSTCISVSDWIEKK